MPGNPQKPLSGSMPTPRYTVPGTAQTVITNSGDNITQIEGATTEAGDTNPLMTEATGQAIVTELRRMNLMLELIAGDMLDGNDR